MVIKFFRVSLVTLLFWGMQALQAVENPEDFNTRAQVVKRLDRVNLLATTIQVCAALTLPFHLRAPWTGWESSLFCHLLETYLVYKQTQILERHLKKLKVLPQAGARNMATCLRQQVATLSQTQWRGFGLTPLVLSGYMLFRKTIGNILLMALGIGTNVRVIAHAQTLTNMVASYKALYKP